MKYYLKALQNYGTLRGRATRSEYWYFVLFNIIFAIITRVIGSTILHIELIGLLYQLLVLMPAIAVGVRRLHDVGKSGWFLLIPIYNLILCCTDSEPGENKYGAAPIDTL